MNARTAAFEFVFGVLDLALGFRDAVGDGRVSAHSRERLAYGLDDRLLGDLRRDRDPLRAVADRRTAVVVPSLGALRPVTDDESGSARPAAKHP